MIAGIGMLRDEFDIAEIVIRHTLAHVDFVLVLDNRSTDGTTEILRGLADEYDERLTVIDDPEVGYYQSRKTTELAMQAMKHGAEWVVPFDADEIWTAGDGTLRDVLEGQTMDVDMIEADCYHHGPTALDDLDDPNPVSRQRWRNRVGGMPKVACRVQPGLTITQGNHGAFYFDARGRPGPVRFMIHHYPARSPEQYQKKIRNGAEAYAAAEDLPVGMGGHWRDLGALSDEQIVAQYWRYYVEDPANDPAMIEDAPTLRT